MKKINLLLPLIAFAIKSYSQTQFEIGYQQNFLGKSKAFEGAKSTSYKAALLLSDGNTPIYGGFSCNYINVTDELIKSNKYHAALLGAKLGVRPLAKVFAIPIQPFFETAYNVSLFKKDATIKNVFSYGGGLEIYFTKKSCLAAYYGIDNYTFDANDKLNNKSASISFRINIK